MTGVGPVRLRGHRELSADSAKGVENAAKVVTPLAKKRQEGASLLASSLSDARGEKLFPLSLSLSLSLDPSHSYIANVVDGDVEEGTVANRNAIVRTALSDQQRTTTNRRQSGKASIVKVESHPRGPLALPSIQPYVLSGERELGRETREKLCGNALACMYGRAFPLRAEDLWRDPRSRVKHQHSEAEEYKKKKGTTLPASWGPRISKVNFVLDDRGKIASRLTLTWSGEGRKETPEMIN